MNALAQAIGAYINLMNPQAVVLGGGVVEGTPAFAEAVFERIPEYSLPEPSDTVDLITAAVPSSKGAVGGAILVREHQ